MFSDGKIDKILFARRWAKYMQLMMKSGRYTIEQIAASTKEHANIDSIEGLQYVAAFRILCACWKYGDELKACSKKLGAY